MWELLFNPLRGDYFEVSERQDREGLYAEEYGYFARDAVGAGRRYREKCKDADTLKWVNARDDCTRRLNAGLEPCPQFRTLRSLLKANCRGEPASLGQRCAFLPIMRRRVTRFPRGVVCGFCYRRGTKKNSRTPRGRLLHQRPYLPLKEDDAILVFIERTDMHAEAGRYVCVPRSHVFRTTNRLPLNIRLP